MSNRGGVRALSPPQGASAISPLLRMSGLHAAGCGVRIQLTAARPPELVLFTSPLEWGPLHHTNARPITGEKEYKQRCNTARRVYTMAQATFTEEKVRNPQACTRFYSLRASQQALLDHFACAGGG
jgi:hypothetical protein